MKITNKKCIKNFVLPTFIGMSLILYIIYFFWTILPSNSLILSDYSQISPLTILNDGEVVDNLKYINENKLLDSVIFDPRNGEHDSSSYEKFSVDTPNRIYDSLVVSPSPNLYNELYSDFLSKNYVKDSRVSLLCCFFYHHSYLYGAMDAINNGANISTVPMVYGYLNTILQFYILKHFAADFDFESYLTMSVVIYLIYFILYVCLLFFLLDNKIVIVLAIAWYAISISFLGGELISLAPGFNPSRHFLDLFVILTLWRYFKTEKILFALAAFSICMISVVWSREFGLILSASVLVAYLYRAYDSRASVSNYILPFLFVIGLALLLTVNFAGPNETSKYMLLGVGAPIASKLKLSFLVLALAFCVYITVKLYHSVRNKHMLICFVIYATLTLYYFIWYPEVHHLLGVFLIFTYWPLFLLDSDRKNNPVILSAVAFITLLILVFGVLNFVISTKDKMEYERSHVLYEWPFKKAPITTVMPPMLFIDAVDLVKRHASHSNEIYLVSKYESVIPILSDKYNNFRFTELFTNLVSMREVNMAMDDIVRRNPPVIFIDNDVEYFLRQPTLLRPYTELYGSGLGREGIHGYGLYALYYSVMNLYEKCEQGMLISAYCKKK